MSNNKEEILISKLTLYLLKKGKEPQNVLKPEYKLVDHPNKDPRFKIVYGSKPGKELDWKNVYGMSDEEARNTSGSRPYGLFFVRFNTNIATDENAPKNPTNIRWMVITHGCGRELLKLNGMEQAFGLLCTLNSIDHITLMGSKSLIMSKQHNVIDHHPKGANMNQFEMLELLKEIQGREFDYEGDKNVQKKTKSVKTSMKGNDALKVKFWDRNGVTLEELPELCKEYYGKFEADTYKERYPLIKNILPVYDISLTDELETKMVKSIVQYMIKGNFDNSDIVELSYPWTEEPLDCEKVKFMNFTNSNVRKEPCEMHLENYLNNLKKSSYEKEIFESGNTKKILESLEKHKVHLIASNKNAGNSQDGTKQDEKNIGSVKKCLVYGTKLEELYYIFIDSAWYVLDSNYIKNITENFDKRVSFSTLPPYKKKCNEFEYNKAACDANGYLLLDDNETVLGGNGRHQFEFGDILTKEAKIYYVKKYGSLSILGYVFSQAEISVNLFQREYEVYETILNMVIKKELEYNEKNNVKGNEFETAIKTLKTNTKNATICIAVIAKKSVQELKLTIPGLILFDIATKEIEKFQYNLIFEWIDDETPKEKKIPDYFPRKDTTSNTSDSGISILADSDTLSSPSSQLKSSEKSLAGQGSASFNPQSSFLKRGNNATVESPFKKMRPEVSRNQKQAKTKNKK